MSSHFANRYFLCLKVVGITVCLAAVEKYESIKYQFINSYGFLVLCWTCSGKRIPHQAFHYCIFYFNLVHMLLLNYRPYSVFCLFPTLLPTSPSNPTSDRPTFLFLILPLPGTILLLPTFSLLPVAQLQLTSDILLRTSLFLNSPSKSTVDLPVSFSCCSSPLY